MSQFPEFTSNLSTANWRASVLAYLQGITNGTYADYVKLAAPIPAGTNSIGTVGLNTGTNSIGVVGLNAGTNSVGTVGLNTGTNFIGSVNPDSTGSGSVTTSTPLVITTTSFGTLAFQSDAVATGTVTIEASVDGTNYTATTYAALTTGNTSSSFNAATATIGQIDTSGFKNIRFRSNTIVGTVGITYNLSKNVSNVMLDNPLPAGSNVIGAVTSNNSEIKVQSSFTRPANTTAYVSGYLVANSTTAGSVVALSFASVSRNAGDCVRIERARINTSNALLTNASFRLHLFEGTPVPTVGDGAAFNASGVLSTSGVAGYLGSISITLSNSGSDGSSGRGVPDVGSAITASPTSGTTIYGLLEATAAYVPTSGAVFTVSLEGYRP